MHLDENQQKHFLYDSKLIEEEGHGERRWSEYMSSVVLADDGKYYRINWDRGLTENQEHTFESGEVEEVFPVNSLRVQSETLYLTKAERNQAKPQLVDKMLAEAESYEIATGVELRASLNAGIVDLAAKLREELSKLAPMDLAGGASAYREATQQYLEAIEAIWKDES